MEALTDLDPTVRACLGQGAKLRLSELKKLHKTLEKAGFSTEDMDAEMELLQGTKETMGLLAILGADDEEEEKDDPAQLHLLDQDQKDLRTWGKATDQVRELVSEVTADHPPAAAVQILNALEAGERDREGGPRKSVLDVIRGARAPLAEKVKKLTVEA